MSEKVETWVEFSQAANPAEEAGEFGLSSRTKLRDFIDGRIKTAGKVVINETTITPAPEGFSADTMIPQWLANVLGAPVRISGGWVLTPDVLTGRERSLIAEFRRLSEKERRRIPFQPVIAEILANYKSFQERGSKTSPQEQLSRILEILESRGFTDEEVLAERPIL